MNYNFQLFFHEVFARVYIQSNHRQIRYKLLLIKHEIDSEDGRQVYNLQFIRLKQHSVALAPKSQLHK